MGATRRLPKLGDVARAVQDAADVAHRAIASADAMPRNERAYATSELAQAVVLLNMAAARINSFCGLDNPAAKVCRHTRRAAYTRRCLDCGE